MSDCAITFRDDAPDAIATAVGLVIIRPEKLPAEARKGALEAKDGHISLPEEAAQALCRLGFATLDDGSKPVPAPKDQPVAGKLPGTYDKDGWHVVDHTADDFDKSGAEGGIAAADDPNINHYDEYRTDGKHDPLSKPVFDPKPDRPPKPVLGEPKPVTAATTDSLASLRLGTLSEEDAAGKDVPDTDAAGQPKSPKDAPKPDKVDAKDTSKTGKRD